MEARNLGLVNATIKGLDECLRALEAAPAKMALRRTLKRIGGPAQTAVAKNIKERWPAMKKPELQQKMRNYVSGDKALVINMTGRPLNIKYFGGYTIQRPGRSGATLQVNPQRGGLKAIHSIAAEGRRFGAYVNLNGNKTVILPRAFTATMPNNFTGIFTRRKGQGRKPFSRNVITMPSMAKSPAAMAAMEAAVDERFGKVLMQQYKYYFEKLHFPAGD